MLVNRVEVDPDFRFFCPMTGELVTGPEDYGPSAATAFLLGPDASEFDYLAPDLEPIWREVQEAHPSLARSPAMLLDDFCRRLERHANLVLFSLSASGVGANRTGGHEADNAWRRGVPNLLCHVPRYVGAW